MAEAEVMVKKVTAFVTRAGKDGLELLLLQHPNAGIQIPAGTVEENEPPEKAALREVEEETGLTGMSIKAYIGYLDQALLGNQRIITRKTKAYARPDSTSFDWAEFRRGIPVEVLRREVQFTQVTYEEWDKFLDAEYVTYRITGWVPNDTLCTKTRRHFFHLSFEGQTPDRWTRFADNHRFQPFWASFASLPKIVEPQCDWIIYVRDQLKYEFCKCTG